MTSERDACFPLRVAVWGIGAHAVKTVLPELAKSKHLTLVGLCSRSQQVCVEQSAIYGCQNWQSAQQMLASNEVDVVYLASPTALHFDHGRAVLNAGKHLWCEKALSANLSDAQTLVSLARSKNLCLAVVCGPKYHSHFKGVQDQLGPEGIGIAKHIKAEFQFPHTEPDNFRYRPDLGGGALLDIGFYLFYVIDALVRGKITELSCELCTEDGYQVDTSGRAQLTYDGATTAELVWGYGGDYTNYISIESDKGTLHAEPFFSKPKNRPPSLVFTPFGGPSRRMDMQSESPFEGMLKRFAEGVRDNDSRNDLWNDALFSQEIMHQAQMSSLEFDTHCN